MSSAAAVRRDPKRSRTDVVGDSEAESPLQIVQPRVQIPEITGSLTTLFVLRTAVAFSLVAAGIACLFIGSQMLQAHLAAPAAAGQQMLFKFGTSFEMTAGGFGAVVMAASLVPFCLAYMSRPTLELIPLDHSTGYGISVAGRSRLISKLKNFRNRLTTRSIDESDDANTSSIDQRCSHTSTNQNDGDCRYGSLRPVT